MSYLSLLPPNSEPPNLVSLNLAPLNPVLLRINSKSKSKNTVKPFRTHLDYQRPIVKVVNNFKEEEIK